MGLLQPTLAGLYRVHSAAAARRGLAARAHPDDLADFHATYMRAAARRDEFSSVCRLRRHDGIYRWVQTEGSPRYDSQGEFVGYIGHCLDITERREVEMEREVLLLQVQEQARRVQGILDTVPEGVLLIDARGQVLLANPVATGDLTVLLEAPKGTPVTRLGDRLLAELLVPPPKGLWHEVKAGGRTLRSSRVLWHKGAAPEHYVLVINDVTLERDIRAQLQQQERLAAVGQLAAGIAHDFNNILAVIILYAQMSVQDPDLPEAFRVPLETINSEARQAASLVQQILDFGRRAVLEPQPMDLVPFLKERVKLLARTLPESIEITLAHPPGAALVKADPARMQQMLTNLAVNARDAMPQGGKLRIGVRRLQLKPGAPPAAPRYDTRKLARAHRGRHRHRHVTGDLSHIFEPFYTTKGPGKGTGLGLAQVYGIVKQHGGHVDVSTVTGEGTTFIVYLPALDDDRTEVPSATAASSPHGRGETILVVEDNRGVRQAVLSTLRMLDYEVLQAHTGQEALAILGS